MDHSTEYNLDSIDVGFLYSNSNALSIDNELIKR